MLHRRVFCSSSTPWLTSRGLRAAELTVVTAVGSRRDLSTEHVRAKAQSLAERSKKVAGHVREGTKDAQKRADSYNDARENVERQWHESGGLNSDPRKTPPRAERGWDAEDKKAKEERGPLGKVNRSPLRDHPNHPANRKKKIQESRDFYEQEQMRDLPRRITYSMMIFASAATIFLNYYQDDSNPWKAFEPVEYVPYEETEAYYKAQLKKAQQQQRAP